MDYIYTSSTNIFKDKEFVLNKLNYINIDFLFEISIHLNEYNKLYEIPENYCVNYYQVLEINNEKTTCEYGYSYNKKNLLTYIFFLNSSTFKIQDNVMNFQFGDLIIFPSEWFFSYTISKTTIIIGYVYVDI
jgi:hypothetical protein